MLWTVLITNVLAAVGFVILAAFLHGAHRTHAYSTYRELEIHHAIVEKPSYTNGVIIHCSVISEQALACSTLLFSSFHMLPIVVPMPPDRARSELLRVLPTTAGLEPRKVRLLSSQAILRLL